MTNHQYHRKVLWPRARRDACVMIKRHAMHVLGGELLTWSGTTIVAVVSGTPFGLSAIYGLAAIGVVSIILLAVLWLYADVKAANDIYAEQNSKVTDAQNLRSAAEGQILAERAAHERQMASVTSAKDAEISVLKSIAESRSPDFFGGVDQVIWGDHSNLNGVVSAVIIGFIRNRGEQSIADNWSIRAELPDGRTLEGEKVQISDMTLFEGEGPPKLIVPGMDQAQPMRVITAKDALYNKTLVPIPRGGMVRGYLLAHFRGVSKRELSQTGTKVVICCHDVNGKQYEIWGVLGGEAVPLGKASYYPGMDINSSAN